MADNNASDLRWRASIEWSSSWTDKRVPRFNTALLPPEVHVSGFAGPVMVVVTMEVVEFDTADRSWKVQAQTYPRIEDGAALTKLGDKITPFNALMKQFCSLERPHVGSRIEVVHYIKKGGDGEMTSQTVLVIDWLAGARKAQANQIARRHEARKDALDTATFKAILAAEPPWHWWEGTRGIGGMLRAVNVKLFSTQPNIPTAVPVPEDKEPDVIVPEVDPWEARRDEVLSKQRRVLVDGALQSLFSIFFVQKDDGAAKLQKAGLGSDFHRTVVVYGDGPNERLWGKDVKTVILPQDPVEITEGLEPLVESSHDAPTPRVEVPRITRARPHTIRKGST